MSPPGGRRESAKSTSCGTIDDREAGGEKTNRRIERGKLWFFDMRPSGTRAPTRARGKYFTGPLGALRGGLTAASGNSSSIAKR